MGRLNAELRTGAMSLLPERGCVEDQPQMLRKPVQWNSPETAELLSVLRLVFDTAALQSVAFG
jgi:hypothetical protein